ncbi:TonB-dependent receptor [Dyadobacter frigoris]|uniref:TonB-dependent siderophore receptor n=1 Tax=Dyadobacter frigoris TaxID=2576211 RepID=A0A4U6D9N2_9BACT|nr:TonB-dependent receptor [Dyadobacter frigoris]TKT94210.1 TonB-dependent siderophore receptor [Dyadobacter frigoris]GLU50600.1 TonB-dependent receptor [Dyadobacter frigoris]
MTQLRFTITLVLAAWLISSSAFSQGTGKIKGTIRTSDGVGAEFVNVGLKGLSKGSTANAKGEYEIKNIEAGKYILIASFIGLETKEIAVDVKSGETTVLSDITLKENAQTLTEVVISAQGKLQRESSEYVSKMNLKNLENPQVYTTITRELLREQLVFSIDDALKNAPGVSKMWEATGRSGDGGSYYNSRGFILQSKLRNGIAGNVSTKIDAANLESIEVIKGPSATLFGSSLTSYGGLINRVTKKPFAKFGGELSYSTGSFGFNRISADINTPLDSAKNILLRVNTAYNYEGSFQDNGFGKMFVFAPSLSYKVNEKLSFNIDAEIFSGQNQGNTLFFFPFGQTIASLGVNRADQISLDYKRSFSRGDLSQTSRNMNFFGQMNYKISDSWTSSTNFTSTNSYSDGVNPYFYILSKSAVTGISTDIGNGYVSRNDQATENSKDRVIEIQQNFNGDFQLAGMRNRFIGGLDFFQRKADQYFTGVTVDTIATTGSIPTYGNFNLNTLKAAYQAGKGFVYPYNFLTNTYSAYVSDVLNITDNLIVSAGLRIDYFDNKGTYSITTGEKSGGYNQTAFSPKFGLIYMPIKDVVSIFANYQNGFTNQVGNTFGGATFKPEHANQTEAGVKLNALNGKLTTTLSYYDIQVSDLIRADVAHPNFSIQDGTQRSKGFEAEIIAQPLRGFNIIAGFAYNDSKFEKADEDVVGLRPATAMSPYIGNLWLSYRIPEGMVRGLGFGFGGNYASDNKVVNSRSQGTFILPEYTILNATAFYEQSKFRFGVKVDNITDKKYWIGYSTMNPQKLRSFTASLSFRF